MSNNKLDDIVQRMQPRMVSYPELECKLLPYVTGFKWGRDAIRDLWLKGAPAPQDKCPGNKPCKAYPRCNHIRRIILPNYFAAWWAEVGERQEQELAASIIYKSLD